MSNINGVPSTSGQAKTAREMSLTELISRSERSGVKTRSTDKLQMKLQNLDGIQAGSSKLNFSRAYNLGTEKFNFVDTAAIAERSNQLGADKFRQESAQLNSHLLLNEKNLRGSRRGGHHQEGKGLRKEDRFASTILSSFSGDPKSQIEKLIGGIDRKDTTFDFEEKDKDGISIAKTPGFNFLQLPKDFNLERGRVNMYRSGIIEVISNDCPPKIFRFKPTTHNTNNISTDLVITTENQAYIDQMNVCIPEAEKS